MASPVNTKEIIQKIAADTGLPKEVVLKAVKSQFEFVRHTIREGNHGSVTLPFFGRFFVKPGRVAHLNENAEKKAARSNEEHGNGKAQLRGGSRPPP